MTKPCGICRKDLSLDEFPVNSQRRDGRNAYCRLCCRQKVKDHRARLKTLPPRVSPIWKETSVDRVWQAIRKGAKTQAEIQKDAGVLPDVLGNALAKLILEEKKVSSRECGTEREYFVRAA